MLLVAGFLAPRLSTPARRGPCSPPLSLPHLLGSRAGALTVNDCPVRGPDPYLHSSAPGPARPPANLRPDTGQPVPAPGRKLRALSDLNGSSYSTYTAGCLPAGRAWTGPREGEGDVGLDPCRPAAGKES